MRDENKPRSRNLRTRTFWHVRPMKTQISLCIRQGEQIRSF